MSKEYQPEAPFNVPFKILSATLSKVNGVNTTTYVEDSHICFCSAKAYIGANKNVNDLSAEEDTLTIESWYNPLLKKNDRIKLLDDDSIWEVPLKPENINRRNKYMKFKAVSVHG